MSELAVLPAEEGVPSVEDIARRISDNAEPDEIVVQMAQAVRSRILAIGQKNAARPCISCRHRISPGTTAAYIGVCVNPVVAEVSYHADSDTMKVMGLDCAEERGVRPGHRKRVHVCGPAGLVHEPMAAPGLLPRLRAYVRWRRLGRNIRH